ncbi:MAG: glycosyltransferase family 4 protein [Verrucomicrobia bacterium]|nr:glycosyltransferase family 4 protein [Verrucomicrobiota bacterium]
MNSIPLTHYFTFFSKLGGVETLLQTHLAADAKWGIDSNVVAFFEPKPNQIPRVSGVGLTWRDCVSSARAKTRSQLTGTSPRVAFYHNFWGVPFLADLDRSTRRVALLHSDWPGMNATLEAQRGLVDGVLCVNDVLHRQVRERMPELTSDRVSVLPLPIPTSPIEASHSSLRDRPLVCGFSGRVVQAQKRVDRLPKLCSEFDRIGLDYRFEILGDGPDRSRLERQFSGNPRIRFHGRKSGTDYWSILSQWDVIVFLSDYEGLPISLLEAFSLGIIPIYPRIQSGGDNYASEVRSDLVYSPDDFGHVARVLQEMKAAPEETVRSLRTRAKRLASPHQGDAYPRTYSEFIKRIVELPRISPHDFPRRPFYWSDYLPFAAMCRIYIRGFYNRNDGGYLKSRASSGELFNVGG